ncbi:glycosyltransferase family 4 protein [Citrobacter youngae]|nr:glycosyltransferase family 4 protein [Citrobacter youngae]
MKITLVTNTVSSIFYFRLRLISRLLQDHHQISILIPETESMNPLIVDLKKLGVLVLFYNASRTGINPFTEFLTIISLYKVIKKISPDVVFSFFPKPIIFGSIAAKLAGVKRIVSMFEGLGFCFTKRPEKDGVKKVILRVVQLSLYKMFLRLSDSVLFLNIDDANELIKKHNIKVRHHQVVGGIGVNLETYRLKDLTYKNGPLTFTMVSRLLIDKGIREYVSAAEIVKREYPDTIFQVIGGMDDNLGGISYPEFEKWKSDNNVVFTGVISNVIDILKSSDVFVLPSYREGVPRSSQEALAVGLPIITTDVPGCKETVVDGVNGFLVPPWDSESLSKKMIELIENKKLLIEMGKQSRLLAENRFDEESFCDRVINILINRKCN